MPGMHGWKVAGQPAVVNQVSAAKAGNASSLDYRYANTTGLPISNLNSPLVTEEQYYSRVVTKQTAGYGCFDVHDPEQRHFGRTLQEVLNRSSSGEFSILSMTEYNNTTTPSSTSSPSSPSVVGPPRLYVFVIWYEKYDYDTLADAPEPPQDSVI